MPMTTFAMKMLGYSQKKLGANWQQKLAASWQPFVHVIFGAFIGALVLLLILLYAGVPIVEGI